MVSVKIYVGTYKKYNEGNLFGKWLDLDDYSNFEQLKEEMYNLHIDEEDPEFMIQDWECNNIINSFEFINESFISDEIYHIINIITESNISEEVLESYISCNSSLKNINEIIEEIEECYVGEFQNDIEFVQSLLEETGEIPSNLPNYIYIDWERTTRDIMMDYTTDNNHYFRNY
jgi:antirestriction protein